MADLPEDDGWVEGVRAIEETDPVRFDVYNESLSALASRTKYLQENMGQGGGGSGTGTPIEWLDGQGMFPEIPEESGAPIPIGLLEPGKHYILDNRSNYLYGILVHSDDEIEEIQGVFECLGGSLNLKEIPVGSEFHFTLAGDPYETYIAGWSMDGGPGGPVEGNPNV